MAFVKRSRGKRASLRMCCWFSLKMATWFNFLQTTVW